MTRVNGVIAMSHYWNHDCRTQAVDEIMGVCVAISKCMDDNPQAAPDGLAIANSAANLDFPGGPDGAANLVANKGNGSSPGDKKCHPVEAGFDFHGVGIDGASKVFFTSQESRGDVIRAREGKCIGLAGAFHR